MNSLRLAQLARRSIRNQKLARRGHGHEHHELGSSEYGMNPNLQASISLAVKLGACAAFFAYPFLVVKYQAEKKKNA
ncbi:hypothetical protein DICPUDRAFT_93201 [Dictyostelium purpureum]|uniref:Uncharacterized protein n=1 Tax=Dictyostelium purpureum TaxID=5786 RepID=F1A3T6_DICPU|nr:uncharacterized protein DICPUDRAFT_93201 [Dictyostelium purpureum]EGC29149.1 hypothetical protein DICPUDRAFT_93201 [Dictyostelium purpureum]|eukprot:XP_003294330.1 hypothetical protein DICPUDRAFT_93201 [Dictyostelium purpureum]